jgi:hypothetical protein
MGREEVRLHAFLTSALDQCEWLASCPGRFTPGGDELYTQYWVSITVFLQYKCWGGRQGRACEVEDDTGRCRSGNTRHFRCDHVSTIVRYSRQVAFTYTHFAHFSFTLSASVCPIPFHKHPECHGTIIWGYFKHTVQGKNCSKPCTKQRKYYPQGKYIPSFQSNGSELNTSFVKLSTCLPRSAERNVTIIIW